MEDEGSYRSLRCHIVHMSLPSRLCFIHVHEVIGALASSAICTSSLILQFHWSYLTWLLYLNIESLETDIDNLDMIEDSQEHKYVPQTHCTYIAATQSGPSPHVAQRHGQFFHLKGLAWGRVMYLVAQGTMKYLRGSWASILMADMSTIEMLDTTKFTVWSNHLISPVI